MRTSSGTIPSRCMRPTASRAWSASITNWSILERVQYNERPLRFEYRLTKKGRELNVALTALRQWGDAHLSEKPPRLLRRKADRKPVVAALVPRSADVLRPDEVELVPGPGLKRT